MFSQLPYMYIPIKILVGTLLSQAGAPQELQATEKQTCRGKVPTSSQFVLWNGITLLAVGIDPKPSVYQESMLISAYNLYIYI